MTRYKRSGSTQQHRKMPGDPTPWSQFFSNDQQSLPPNPSKKGENSTVAQDLKTQPFKRHFSASNTDLDNASIEKMPFPKQAIPNKKMRQERSSSEQASITNVPNVSENMKIENDSFSNETVSNKRDKKNKKNKFAKGSATKAKESETVEDMKIEGQSERAENSQNPEVIPNLSRSEVSEKKKKYFMQKLRKSRAENGITLLPPNSERKLYKIRRKLRNKGMPPADIKEIMRKERRKEELKFRETFNPSRPCYNCRKPGHLLANCPEKFKSSKQETGICFKCGSDSHTSFKCPSEVQGFPFAKCFVCKEQGHISRDCPINAHGVYINGGKCNMCGNVNHLRKDCPSLKKIKAEEPSITLHTMNEVTSIDEEITERKIVPKKNENKPRYVKFT